MNRETLFLVVGVSVVCVCFGMLMAYAPSQWVGIAFFVAVLVFAWLYERMFSFRAPRRRR